MYFLWANIYFILLNNIKMISWRKIRHLNLLSTLKGTKSKPLKSLIDQCKLYFADNFLSYIFRIIQSITDKFNTNLRCIWKICSFSSRQRTKKPDIIFDLSKILEKAAKYKSYCKNVKCILPSKVRKYCLIF